MKLEIIMDRELNNNLFWNIENETTPFAIREGVEYKGWALEALDCNGPEAMYCDENGHSNYLDLSDVAVGIRPSIAYSQIKQYSKLVRNIKKGCIEVEFGEYPQYPATEEVQEKLNEGLLTVEKTGKNYTVYNNDEQNPGTIELEEVVDKDGNKYINKNNTWYMVSPISWIVDENHNIAISKNIIAGGIPYGEYKVEYLSEFEEEFERKHPMKLPPSVRRMHALRKVNPTIIEGFLNVVLSKDILTKELADKIELSNREKEKAAKEKEEQKPLTKTRYHFNENWLNQKLLPTKLIRDSFLDRLLDTLGEEQIQQETIELGLSQEEAKVYVKRNNDLKQALINYKK